METASDSAVSIQSAAADRAPRPSLTIAAGNFFFHRRNTLFPIVMSMAALAMRPRVIGSPELDRTLIAVGIVIALAGQAFRLFTIGLEYIERGGKDGKVYASRLVQGGIYAHTRNPMYLGNVMITVGIVMMMGSPGAYVLIIPVFAFIYHSIARAEEAYLRTKFSQEYAAYCARVPRLFPSLRGFGETLRSGRYNWKRAIRQDLSTLTGTCAAVAMVPFWRVLWLDGTNAFVALLPRVAVSAAIIGLGYATLHEFKHRQLLQ